MNKNLDIGREREIGRKEKQRIGGEEKQRKTEEWEKWEHGFSPNKYKYKYK